MEKKASNIFYLTNSCQSSDFSKAKGRNFLMLIYQSKYFSQKIPASMFFMLKICDNDLTVQSSGGGRRKRIFKLLYCTRASMRAPIHIYTHLVTECAIHAGGVNASDPSTVNGQTSIYPRFLPLSGCNFTDPNIPENAPIHFFFFSLFLSRVDHQQNAC